MKYGQEYPSTLVNRFTREEYHIMSVYKRAEWHGYHTNDDGDGLWHDDKQLLGTCQFTVRGCKTEKGAIAKIRKHVNLS